MPAFAIILLQDAVLPLSLRGGSPTQALAALSAALSAVLLGAGWYALMGRAVREGNPSWTDFLDGINARWLTLLVGTLAQWGLVLAWAAMLFWYGEHTYGWERLLAWFKPLLELPPAAQQAALDPSRIPAWVVGWMNLFALWFVSVAVLHVLLLFWQPMVVLKGLSWPAAWLGSCGLTLRRFTQVLAIGLLHGVAWLGARLMIATLHPAFTLIGVMAYMVTVAFFTLAYTMLVEDEWPARAPNLDVRA